LGAAVYVTENSSQPATPARISTTEAKESFVDRFALLALLRARPGKEKALEEFLKSAQPLAVAEPATTSWYAIKLGPDRFGIFDTFPDEAGRDAHLNGRIAMALMGMADELLADPPQIEKVEILAAKSPSS
jgi:quinol monooxygenase YgiN